MSPDQIIAIIVLSFIGVTALTGLALYVPRGYWGPIMRVAGVSVAVLGVLYAVVWSIAVLCGLEFP